MSWVAISRPWFWLYLAGPYLVGYAASTSISGYANPAFWVFLAYFLFPANLLLYGVNDLYDTDTDEHNPKKGGAEHALTDDEHSPLFIATLVLTGASFIGAAMIPAIAGLFLTGFVVLAWAYSAPPLRLKARPVFDSASNILYILPGLTGFYLNTGSTPSVLVLIAVALWAIAMHLYSAIPDIEADRQAGLRTTAVVLGEQRSLAVCLGLWTAFTVLLTAYDPWLIITAVYPVLCAAAMIHGKIATQYWWYPYINAAFGFTAYWYVTLPLL
jgi:4-hydroxybenzoate polyprenyltransferase